MEYELYWNTNRDHERGVYEKMVIGGCFGTISDARAYCYKAIGRSLKFDITKKDGKVISIMGVDSEGYFFDYGKVGKVGSQMVYVSNKNKYYSLSKDGSITAIKRM